jgi:N-acetylglucosaminyldiphosphoundecaprenol N-acetyl-beta-D-mannosaminyltransferase
MLDNISILGIKINNLSLREAVEYIERTAHEREFSYTVTPNIDHMIKLQSDVLFREIYEEASLVVADGVPLVWASRFLGTPLKGRVNGTDLFERLASRAAEKGDSIYLLGGEKGAAEKAAKRLQERHPSLLICGSYCPPLGFEEDDMENNKIIKNIRDAHPTYLFVGLGAPKQEKWIAKHGISTGARHAIGIGISFSIVAGMQTRAPRWMQRSGLEWSWRLGAEPLRLWRRYLINDPRFFWLILYQKLSKRKWHDRFTLRQ